MKTRPKQRPSYQPGTEHAEEARQGQSWETLAQRDPFWATLSSGRRHVDWALDEFMLTGAREIGWALAHASSIDALPASTGCALDFGCGPGRLTASLGNMFRTVIGVDISPTMLQLARKACSDARFSFSLDLDTIPSDSVDLAYSTFVLQHLTPAARLRVLRDIHRCLHQDGIFIFQMPITPKLTPGGLVWKTLPLNALMWIQRRVLRYPDAMPMRWLTRQAVEIELRNAGLRLASTAEGLTYSPNWHDVWYYAKLDS